MKIVFKNIYSAGNWVKCNSTCVTMEVSGKLQRWLVINLCRTSFNRLRRKWEQNRPIVTGHFWPFSLIQIDCLLVQIYFINDMFDWCVTFKVSYMSARAQLEICGKFYVRTLCRMWHDFCFYMFLHVFMCFQYSKK